MNRDKISIIVPFYNVERFFRRNLDSIANQTYQNIEVIIVNDGSTDRSRDIALEFVDKDSRFKLFDKENGGLSSGRNYGLERATGKYVCFVDSDDYLDTNYISSLISGFDAETDVVIGDYAIYDYKRNKTYSHSSPVEDRVYKDTKEKEELLRDLIIRGRPVMSVWKNMYKTSFLKNSGIMFESEREIYAEDELFHVLVYSEARKIRSISIIVYYHVYVENSLSQGYRRNYFDMLLCLRAKIINNLEKYGYSNLAKEYESHGGSIIGPTLLNACKTNFVNAKRNIEYLLSEQRFNEMFEYKREDIHAPRYRLLYDIAKTKNPLFIVIVVKSFLACNSVYRYMKRKKHHG
jgi:glycosyltransferase involved in cell wall biosynthesis